MADTGASPLDSCQKPLVAKRRKRQENAYIFHGALEICLAEVQRQDWEWAIEMADGNVSKAAADIGLKDVPKGAKVLWGKSSAHALNEYRQWQNKKSKKK